MPVLADGTIDVAQGLAWMEANLDPARRNKGGTVTPSTGKLNTPPATMAEVKRALVLAQAQRARLAYDRERGQVIDAKEAAAAVFVRAKAERDAHIAWVSRTAPLLAAELGADPARTYAALDRMMREHLEHLADTPIWSLTNGG
jgi:hypothetical protein